MKIVILGAAGIIGQHMRLCVPAGVEPVWVRRSEDLLHRGLDLTDGAARVAFLEGEKPDAIVNLAGESRPDVVERDPEEFCQINTLVPGNLAWWCEENGCHYVHVSTQAVFSGKEPPYGPDAQRNPANLYGCQKHTAEVTVQGCPDGWTIVRPTFALGVRPMPAVGRMNPAEQMLGPGPQRHADDRWFSVSFADEVARELWTIATGVPRCEVVQIGGGRLSRYQLADMVNPEGANEPVSHNDFPGIAARPVDTTYAEVKSRSLTSFGITKCVEAFRSREALGHSRLEAEHGELTQRAREISIFTGLSEEVCRANLEVGFGVLHEAVTEDFRRANPKNDAELLEWYRTTESYIWELSAYHADKGFSYGLMCDGLAAHLKTNGKRRVLCLGDGIGDCTLTFRRAGLDAVYHDLEGSRTAEFARSRFYMYLDKLPERWTSDGWAPDFHRGEFDAVVSLDFLEHVTDVPEWSRAIYGALKPGGLFCSWDSFGCASGPQGAMPMHLARNDRFATEWDEHLAGLGFVQESDDWYRKAASGGFSAIGARGSSELKAVPV